MNLQKLLITGILFLIFLQCNMPVKEQNTLQNEALTNRRAVLIDQIADGYNPPSMQIGDPQKYYWPKVMARFEKYGTSDSLANQWIDQLAPRGPFHFTYVGMARIMSLYPDAPALQQNKKLLLRKVFERIDGHNPWTSEGTENHINMDRTSGYLYAQHALDYPDDFPDASERMAKMKHWIKQWSERVYRYGTGEWNSSIYQAYNIIGWLNLYDFAEDEQVKQMARAVIDYYTAEMALHYSWGSYGGSEKRSSGARNRSTTASDYLCWYWFGNQLQDDPMVEGGSEYIQSVHAATSSYAPPQPFAELALKEQHQGQWYQNSKPSYLYETPSFVKQFFYIGKNYTLGTAVSPYGGFTGSTYQYLNWKLSVRSDQDPSGYEISGNGRFLDNWSGANANPWTQFFQHRNVLIQLTQTPQNHEDIIEEVREVVSRWAQKWQQDFSIRFPGDPRGNVVNFARNIVAENRGFITVPENATFTFEDNRAFGFLENTYFILHFISAANPDAKDNLLEMEDGRIVFTDQAALGKSCGFVLEVFDENEFDGFDHFQRSFSGQLDLTGISSGKLRYTSHAAQQIEMQYNVKGTFTEATYDWGFGAHEPYSFITSPPFRQPQWPKGEGYGMLPEVIVNGLHVDFQSETPVFDGPDLQLKNRILTLSGSEKTYTVNYRSDLPGFGISDL